MVRPRSSPSQIATQIEETDLAIAYTAGRWRDHPIVAALGRLGELADQPQLYTITASTMLAGIVRGDRRLARAGLRMLAAEWIATRAKTAVKNSVDRTRPKVPVEGGAYRMERGDSHESDLSSFPSGHTAGAVAVARAYASEYPEHAGRAAAAAIFVGAIQIPRCRHFISDVGAGAVIGLVAGSLVGRSAREAHDKARPPVRAETANGLAPAEETR